MPEPLQILGKRLQVSISNYYREIKQAKSWEAFLRLQAKLNTLESVLHHFEKVEAIGKIKGATPEKTVEKRKKALEILIKEAF